MNFSGLQIGLVGPLAPPSGGMALQTAQLAELLTRAGAQVELVQTNRPCRPAWVGRVPVLRALFRLLPYLACLWRVAGRSDLVHLMANSGWSWHLYCAPAIWLARWRGVPVVVNYRGGGAGAFLERSGAVVGASLRRSQGLLVPSGFLREVFSRHGLTAEVVPNIIDVARYRPTGDELPPSTPPHLVVPRNLERIYGNDVAIRALQLVRARHPDATLTLAGSGPELQALRALAAELGLADAVRFAGRLDRDGMAALYRSAHVVLNPSLTDNMPNSVLEALSCGAPVVSTDVGGVPHLLQHGETALLVPPSQPEAMASAACQLLEQPSLRLRLVDNGLREVQRYTWPRVAPVLRDAYSRAMARVGRPTGALG